jgi:methionyl-tRNA formyltransferase
MESSRVRVARLRVAYAGHDFFASCLKALLERADIDIVLCLTSPPGDRIGNVLELAYQSHIPVLFGRPGKEIISIFNRSRVDLLISAAYSYRIPVDRFSVSRTINVHPTLLPYGRGPAPLSYLIDAHRDLCGISLHEMTCGFDQGPVLLQEAIPLASSDGYDELVLKLYAAAPRLLNKCLDNLDEYFSKKIDQGLGSYWEVLGNEQRVLVAAEARAVDALYFKRKFGSTGIIVQLADGTSVKTGHLVASECEHSYSVGSVVARMRAGWIIALTDGLMRISEPLH